jgi:hypothetical protein
MEKENKQPMPLQDDNEAKTNPAKTEERASNKYWAEHKATLLGTLITAVATLGGAAITIVPQISTSVDPEYAEDYYVNYSYYHVQLADFIAISDTDIGDKKSLAAVDRIDSITKNRATSNDYKLPFYTTGAGITVETLKSSVIPTFDPVPVLNKEYRHGYEFRLKLGDKPVGDREIMHNVFNFVDGFRNGKEEWWAASIKYPTKSIGVHIQCPKTKPCTKVKVYRRKGYGSNEEIVDNPAFLSKDGQHIMWMGNDEKTDTRIMFNWSW